MTRTLLLADDSVTIQKVVGISFANEDVRLVTVDNGDDAVARIREERPDLVLADVVMPGKSGYEVCEVVKSDADLQHIPVLLLSGTFEAFDDDRAQRAGADGHITKPFEAQTLVDRVNQLLTAAPSAQSTEPSSEPAYDFFDEEAPVADAGETTVVADDLEFGASDQAFEFDASDPLPLPGEEPAAADLAATPAPARWSDDEPRAAAASEDDGLDGLGLDAPDLEPAAGSLLGEEGPDPVLDAPRDDISPADATRALGLDVTVSSPPQDEADDLRSSEFDVSSSDLGDPMSPAPPTPAAGTAASPSTEALRAEVVDALEKIAWEAFGELTEQLVRQTVAKVEAIAWEVIPEMAERLVREEIEKLKS